ncbi:divalent metal cation transporter [Flavobacteriaceae bacterium F89]|uniref:Divalent metal cation transporter n=1 Tax=Cerina litoralis TaxID=2874477 RepID=A0AAE3ES06_9FLAO|nr:divalent metal cation transporter [Cerina litoralis]MCG2459893.1 divalent metal cation transporter [Cerina litoralis]
MTKFSTLLKNIGPGLLFASTAIGTSHLVLSTKAGAQYGWLMIIPIVLANVLKYPFFEFGVRYTNVTNKSLIEGYRNRGKNYLWLYAGITLVTTFTILATLYVVTAGLFINLFHIPEVPLSTVALGLFIFIGSLLIIGRYKLLEISLKFVVTLLFIALLVTTSLVIFRGQAPADPNFVAPDIFNEVGILFLIGLVGWMPTAVEASSWISLWSIEKYKSGNKKPSLSEALQEFNFGYFLTALLAIFFLIIGWLTLYGTGTQISGNAVAFADQLVSLFTSNIGSWTYVFIATAAFATMFSTCMTAHDALARVSIDILELLFPKLMPANKKKYYVWGIVLLVLINYIVITAFSANMGQLVAMATFVSFVLAPVIGYMNLKNVMSHDLPSTFRPKSGLRALTYLGIIFLSLFALYYCWMVVF